MCVCMYLYTYVCLTISIYSFLFIPNPFFFLIISYSFAIRLAGRARVLLLEQYGRLCIYINYFHYFFVIFWVCNKELPLLLLLIHNLIIYV